MSNGNSEKIKTDDENYYTEFLRQLAAEKIKLSNIDVDIKYISRKMNQQDKQRYSTKAEESKHRA